MKTAYCSIQRVTAKFITKGYLWGNRVRYRAEERLEPCEGKPSRTVLRGQGDGNISLLPDTGPFTVAQIASEIQQFRARFTILEDAPAVLEQLLELLATGASTKVFDTTIVATMLVGGVRRLHTNNPRDFAPFAGHITVIPLVPPPL